MRGTTLICNEAELTPVAPKPFGSADTEIDIEPFKDGVQMQLATIFGVLPVVPLLTHPEILLPLAKKVTNALAETLVEIENGFRNCAVADSPDIELITIGVGS